MVEPLPLAAGATPEPDKAKDTTAGNYFVSNYPPYSFWKPEHVAHDRAVLTRPPAPDTPLGLYLHIPFCRKRCHFCYFKVYTDKNFAEIAGYVQGAIRELQLYAQQPFIGGRRPTFVYFGGGTPSYLSVEQLADLVNGMKAVMPWDQVEEVTFECEPGTLNEKKLAALRDFGVTRLSLGVEHFNDAILKLNGRAHGAAEIPRAYHYAREVGFPQINIDLIAGMMDETDATWQQAIDETLKLAPDSITIYQMEIPFNTTIYKRMKEDGTAVAPVADWDTKRHWTASAFAQFEKAGYTISSAYTAVKDPQQTRFVYRDQLWRSADLVGLGVSSFGHIGGVHLQNEHQFEGYMAKIERGELPIFRSLETTAEERLIREVVLQFKLGRLDVGYFQRKFQVDIRERFRAQFAEIQQQGYLSITGEQVQLNREGLLRVDWMLQNFFLDRHKNVRYA